MEENDSKSIFMLLSGPRWLAPILINLACPAPIIPVPIIPTFIIFYHPDFRITLL